VRISGIVEQTVFFTKWQTKGEKSATAHIECVTQYKLTNTSTMDNAVLAGTW
jgi:hypothetical protein